MAAAPWSWGELAQGHARAEKRAKRKASGARVVPQATIEAMLQDAKTMPLGKVAARHGVSRSYAYQVIYCGLRSPERERAR